VEKNRAEEKSNRNVRDTDRSEVDLLGRMEESDRNERRANRQARESDRRDGEPNRKVGEPNRNVGGAIPADLQTKVFPLRTRADAATTGSTSCP